MSLVKRNLKNPNGYCIRCHINGIGKKRAGYGHLICKPCGEAKSKNDRRFWTVLSLHKQGAMFFTPDTALEVAVGANCKGGIVK